jgi:hypothetical protein
MQINEATEVDDGRFEGGEGSMDADAGLNNVASA